MRLAILVTALLAAATSLGGLAPSLAAGSKGPSRFHAGKPRPEGSQFNLIRVRALRDDVSESEALVAKAHDLTNLTELGSAPFAFRAAVLFNDPSGDVRVPPAQGTYALTWQSADKWREDADMLHLKQTRIANGDALWTKRNAPYPSFAYWWTHDAVEILHGVAYHFDSHTHVEISQLNGRNVVCMKNSGTRLTEELCLDTVTAFPLLQFDSTLRIQFVYGDWSQWRGHWYPRTIKGFNGSELVIRIEIPSLSDASPESKWIAPPREATQRAWCSAMRPAQLSDAIENISLPDPGAPGGASATVAAIVYGVIGKDGSWLDLSVLESPNFKAAFEMLDKFRAIRNQPATCQGQPVESETIFRISPPR